MGMLFSKVQNVLQRGKKYVLRQIVTVSDIVYETNILLYFNIETAQGLFRKFRATHLIS